MHKSSFGACIKILKYAQLREIGRCLYVPSCKIWISNRIAQRREHGPFADLIITPHRAPRRRWREADELRSAALKPGKQRKPQHSRQHCSVPSATQIPVESSAAAAATPWAPARSGSYKVSGALVPSASYRSLKVPVSVYVCVAGSSGFSAECGLRDGAMLWCCGFGGGVLNFLFCHSASSKRMVPLARTPFQKSLVSTVCDCMFVVWFRSWSAQWAFFFSFKYGYQVFGGTLSHFQFF